MRDHKDHNTPNHEAIRKYPRQGQIETMHVNQGTTANETASGTRQLAQNQTAAQQGVDMRG
jgi:hypothetical protein